MPEYPKTEGDQAYERYQLLGDYRDENDIPGDDLLPHDTRITQSLSEPSGEAADTDELLAEDSLPDVPDADEIQPGSPVDQVAPDPDAMHGTDLLNGFDGDETE
ncbi:hypothetical protein [Paenibacillus sp. Marseille-P2973]|uniref:hypothetical protein n=1 Tax=Paenibacillus sp. Marseille-P2973 TaxID=1871032 RepID=UPI001FFC414F|nr:hypothetical protein [Paenibacillus sp. Marseille-P2973]